MLENITRTDSGLEFLVDVAVHPQTVLARAEESFFDYLGEPEQWEETITEDPAGYRGRTLDIVSTERLRIGRTSGPVDTYFSYRLEAEPGFCDYFEHNAEPLTTWDIRRGLFMNQVLPFLVEGVIHGAAVGAGIAVPEHLDWDTAARYAVFAGSLAFTRLRQSRQTYDTKLTKASYAAGTLLGYAVATGAVWALGREEPGPRMNTSRLA